MTPREKAELNLKLTEEVPSAQNGAEVERIHFPEQWIVLAKRKSFILKFVGIAAALTTITVFLLPKTYTANSKIMPPQQNQSMGAAAALSQLGQLGPLAALAGKDLGLRNPSDIYIALLRSRTVQDALINRFSLMDVYGIKWRIDAEHRLEDRTEISAGKGGVIAISVEDRDRHRAADLANGYVDELEKLTRTLAVTEAGQRRIFFEREMKQANDDLANAEVALKQTQEKTGLILLDSQSRAIIESLTSLRARVAAQEVLVQQMRTFAAPENPDLIREEKALEALRDQLNRLEGGQGKRLFTDVPLENVPARGLEYIRKLREVKYHETLFELLAKQYEAARIDEARDAFVVQQLDKAIPPEKQSWPKRSIVVLVATFLALLVAIAAATLMDAVERANEDPQFAARRQLFQFYLRGQQKS